MTPHTPQPDCKVDIESFGPPASRTRVSSASAQPWTDSACLMSAVLPTKACGVEEAQHLQKGTFHG